MINPPITITLLVVVLLLVLLLLVADTAAVVGPGKNISITLSAALQSFWVVVVVVAIALLLYSLCEFVVSASESTEWNRQHKQCLPLLVLLNLKSKNCNFSLFRCRRLLSHDCFVF